MTDYRSKALSIPEMKQLELSEVFLEIARMQGALARIDNDMKFAEDTRSLLKARRTCQKALDNLVAELSSRYVEEPEARQAVLFRLTAGVATAAITYAETIGYETVDDSIVDETWELLQEAIETLEALR